MIKDIEKRLTKDEKRASLYQQQINDMLQRGVARKLSDLEIENYNGPTFYISHHEVMKPQSESTPCRIVFNSSARFGKYTLNDYWAKGPDIMNNQLGIMIRFREERVAIMGDLKKMYHSIKISEIDQHVHRFLWRDFDVYRDPDTYIMTTVSFGDKPAGTIATVAFCLLRFRCSLGCLC